jgi:hypothetical protein
MTRDDEIAALLRELEAEKRREIDRLGIPPWENEAEVARVAEQRIMVKEYSNFCAGLISSGHLPNTFVFNPPIEMEWWPDAPEGFDHNNLQWNAFVDALRSGRKKEVARLASYIRETREQVFYPPPRHVFELMLDFLGEKINSSANRPPGSMMPSRARALTALPYHERVLAELHDMFPNNDAVRRRARKIAATKYNVTVNDLERSIYRENERRP